MKSITIAQIAEGSTLLINKPLHWTSFDVVNKLKGLLRKPLGKKFKIGHAGTLDPLATGLLIVCTGKNTKIIQGIQDAKKTYHATFFIGATRPSFDKETEIDATFPIAHITAEKIQSTAINFIGKQTQMPPIFSALKKDGKPIYLKARKGIEVTVEARQIDIEKFDITMINLPIVEATIVCSKGTYIRSIAKDFGEKLESGAYLDGLVRTGIGENSAADAWNMEDLVSHIQNQIDVSAD